METTYKFIAMLIMVASKITSVIVRNILRSKHLSLLSPIAQKAVIYAQDSAIEYVRHGLTEYYNGNERARIAMDWVDANMSDLKISKWQAFLIKKLIPSEYKALKAEGKIRPIPKITVG